ncbi:MAG TPA: hypothetical protein VHU80_03035 [Polyangiaceae bacterium]|jgi:hypothetical protein|nr:hypothetical protein [Polyangiaceae bacterium]
MRVYQIVVLAIVLGTALPVFLHHDAHGVYNAHQIGLAFFLWLNAIVALWEICLYLRIDLIEEQHVRFVAAYRGRELDRVKDFFALRVPVGRILSPTVWAELWSSYSVFDPSYADRKSFGFFVDIGNGFSTLVPTLLFLYGMTYEPIPARALGVVGLLVFYQMWYGTLVYLASYLMNKRYRGHSFFNVALFVGLSNGLWLTFPLWGIAISIVLIGSGSYAIFH